MRIFKFLKYILLSILVVALLLFFVQNMIPLVISLSIKLSQGNLLILTIIYGIELFFAILIYDLVIMKIYNSTNYLLSKLGRYAIKWEKIGITLWTIRLNYYFERLNRILRLYWVIYGRDEESSVWKGISKPSLARLLVNFLKIIISVPMLLAFLGACISLKILRGDFTYYVNEFKEFLRGILQIKLNVGDIFSRLPALVALITMIPVIFFFYFYSQKRNVRKIIETENSRYFKEVVLLYQKLLIWIDNHIYELSENFDYVIGLQDLIAVTFLEKKIPAYKISVGKQHLVVNDINKFRFIEITDLTELRDIIAKLSSDRLKKYTEIFSAKRFDVWYLYSFDFYKLNEEEKIEKVFYTKKGMTSNINNCIPYTNNFGEEQIEKCKKEELSLLSMSIYDNLELLYRMKRASDSLRKYLYSSRVENMILKALNKDK